MPKRAEKIFKNAHGEKSLKAPFAIYLDLECLLKQEQSCKNNPEKLYTKKKAKHEPSGWAIFTKGSFDAAEHKLDYYRGRDYIEKLCKKLKEHTMKTIKKLNGTMELIFYKKKCKKGMERKKIKSECDFVGVRDNSLEYRCKECREI